MGTGIKVAVINQIKEYAQEKAYDKALTLIRQQDLSQSYNSQFVRICGEVLLYTQNYEECRKVLLMAHKIAPEGNRINYDLIQLYIETGELALADKYYEQYVFNATEHDTEMPWLNYMIARSRRASGQELFDALEPLYTQDRADHVAYEFLRIFQWMGAEERFEEEYQYIFDNFRDSEYKKKAKHLKETGCAGEELFVYPESSILRHDDKVDADETLLLEQDYFRMHPKEPEIVLMADDYDAQDDQSIAWKLWSQRRREKAEKKAAARAEKKAAKLAKKEAEAAGKQEPEKAEDTKQADDEMTSQPAENAETETETVGELEPQEESLLEVTDEKSPADEAIEEASAEEVTYEDTLTEETVYEDAIEEAVEESVYEAVAGEDTADEEAVEEVSAEEVTYEDTLTEETVYEEAIEETVEESVYEAVAGEEVADEEAIEEASAEDIAYEDSRIEEAFVSEELQDDIYMDVSVQDDMQAYETVIDMCAPMSYEVELADRESESQELEEVEPDADAALEQDKHQQAFDEYDELLKKEEARLAEQFEREARLLREAESLLASVQSGVDDWNSQKVNNLFEAFDMDYKDVTNNKEEAVLAVPSEELEAAKKETTIETKNQDFAFEASFESLNTKKDEVEDLAHRVEEIQSNREMQSIKETVDTGDAMQAAAEPEIEVRKPHTGLREHTKSMLTLDARKKDILQQLKERR